MATPEMTKAVEDLKAALKKELPQILKYMACIWLGAVLMLIAVFIEGGIIK